MKNRNEVPKKVRRSSRAIHDNPLIVKTQIVSKKEQRQTVSKINAYLKVKKMFRQMLKQKAKQKED